MFRVCPRNPYGRGRLGTVDLLVQTSIDPLLLILKILFTFFTKQATLMRRSIVLSVPFQLVFPVSSFELGLYFTSGNLY